MTSPVIAVDYGGVLTNPITETIDAFLAKTGLSPGSLATALQRCAAPGDASAMAALERGERTEADFLISMAVEMRRFGHDDIPNLASHFRSLWLSGRTANTEFLSYLDGLATRGVRLALVTNNVREWEDDWRKTIDRPHLFEAEFVSCELGCRKPEERYYLTVLTELGLPASEILFIDDTRDNLVIAEVFGFSTIHFTSTSRSIAEIERWLARKAAAHVTPA